MRRSCLCFALFFSQKAKCLRVKYRRGLWLFLGASWLCREGEAEALVVVFLVPWFRRAGGTEALTSERFCNGNYCNSGNWYLCCRGCHLFNIAGLLSSASQLVLGANVDPCEPY